MKHWIRSIPFSTSMVRTARQWIDRKRSLRLDREFKSELSTKKGATYRCTLDPPDAATDPPYVALQGWILTRTSARISNLALVDTAGGLRLPLIDVRRPEIAVRHPFQTVTGFRGLWSLADIAQGSGWQVMFDIDGVPRRHPTDLRASPESARDFASRKARKRSRIRDLLKCPTCEPGDLTTEAGVLRCASCGTGYPHDGRSIDFLTHHLRARAGVVATGNISSNEDHDQLKEFAVKHAGGLVLDAGCGLRGIYRDNVVNLEIVDYPTTDVVGVGERLPFRSSSFDAVCSAAVLEHVRDPFQVARELVRVLKPGGDLFVAVPFLQPFHGYPDHYYNMTSSGLRALFEGSIQVGFCGVEPWGHPIHLLPWFLQTYLAGLPPDIADRFRRLTVEDLATTAPTELLRRDIAASLADEAVKTLAYGFTLTGTKGRT